MAFAKTKTLSPQATSTREASPRHLLGLLRQKPYHKHPKPSPQHLPRQELYHKHPRTITDGICQDTNPRTITTAFAKIKTLPQAPTKPSPRPCQDKNLTKGPAEPSPWHLPRQKNLTTSTRGAFATAFAKTKTLPQAPAEPSPRHLPRQKP